MADLGEHWDFSDFSFTNHIKVFRSVTVAILHAVILQVAVNQEREGCSLGFHGRHHDSSRLRAYLMRKAIDDIEADAGGLLHNHLLLSLVAKELLEVCQYFSIHPDPGILDRY